jgi:hypothetical protein
MARVRRHVEIEMKNPYKKPGVVEAYYEGLRRAGLPEAATDAPLLAASMMPAGEHDATMVQPRQQRAGQMSRHVLIVSRPGERDREVLVGTAPLLLGRAPESDVLLSDAQVSRAHCRIVLTDGEVTATDLNSTNGTLLDGEPLDRIARLESGAMLRIGPYDIEYLRRDPADLDDTRLSNSPRPSGATSPKPPDSPTRA